MKRFLIIAALLGGALLASAPGDAMAHGRRWYGRRGYYGGYYPAPVYRHAYRRPGFIVQTPGVYVAPGYGTVYYGW